MIHDTIHDVQYAWRTFTTAPLAAFTIVVTVAIGLGVVAVLFTVLNTLISQIVLVSDPVSYLGSLGVIVAACLSAAWIPAARAAKLDPMRTLRQE